MSHVLLHEHGTIPVLGNSSVYLKEAEKEVVGWPVPDKTESVLFLYHSEEQSVYSLEIKKKQPFY